MTITTYLNFSPTIDSTAYVAASAQVIGKVTIGANTSVWPGAVIRGDMHTIDIGQGCSIQDNSVLHITHDGPYSPGGSPLKIGDFVTIGHSCTIHACTINNYCLVGIGSIVLDRAVLEERVMLGAGSLVPTGKVLESGYLYHGNPAKQIRELSAQELEFFSYTANNYIKLKNTYKSSENA